VNRFFAATILWLSLGLRASTWAASAGAVASNEAGGNYFRQGKFSEAVAEFKKALREDPSYLPAQVNLAYAYERLNRLDEAIQGYQAALALAPDNFFARNNLGVLYDKKGNYDDAITEFESVLRSEPGNAMALSNLATAKKNKAIVQERKAQIERAEKDAQAKPKDPQASYYVARLYASQGNKPFALQWLDKALKQGLTEIASVKSDPAFATLRDDRDFQLVLLGK
jgi:tetratricopeptide (TPR) repeat protein